MGTPQVCVHKINDMLNGDEVQYGIEKGVSFFLIAYSSNFKLQCSPNSISTNKWKRKAKTVVFIIHINTFYLKSVSFTFLSVFCTNDNSEYQKLARKPIEINIWVVSGNILPCTVNDVNILNITMLLNISDKCWHYLVLSVVFLFHWISDNFL